MKTFEEFQAAASKLPASVRNNRDRINLPVTGLQEEAGKISAFLSAASAPGRFELTLEQQSELRDRLADVLWYTALLCHEADVPLQQVATHSVAQLEERLKRFNSDAR